LPLFAFFSAAMMRAVDSASTATGSLMAARSARSAQSASGSLPGHLVAHAARTGDGVEFDAHKLAALTLGQRGRALRLNLRRLADIHQHTISLSGACG